MASKIASLDLQHGKFNIVGPPGLVTLIENAQKSLPPKIAQTIVEHEVSSWCVICAVAGDTIPLTELKYWSVERQECYKNAEASLVAFQKSNP